MDGPIRNHVDAIQINLVQNGQRSSDTDLACTQRADQMVGDPTVPSRMLVVLTAPVEGTSVGSLTHTLPIIPIVCHAVTHSGGEMVLCYRSLLCDWLSILVVLDLRCSLLTLAVLACNETYLCKICKCLLEIRFENAPDHLPEKLLPCVFANSRRHLLRRISSLSQAVQYRIATLLLPLPLYTADTACLHCQQQAHDRFL